MARKAKQKVVEQPVKHEPISRETAIAHAIQQFNGEIIRFERGREKFLIDVTKNISFAVEWADGILQADYVVGRLKPLVTAFEEQKTGDVAVDFELLKIFVERARKDNRKSLLNDWFRGNSTSDSHNTVQHNHRAGASHLEDIFESISYWIADAEKGIVQEK